MPATELEVYLNYVLPWEDPQHAQLYKCVTTFWIAQDGRKIPVNEAVKTYDDLVKLIEVRSRWRTADVYLALGTQKLADVSRPSRDGLAVRADRSAKNMATFNSLFLDVDVGKGDGYADTSAALTGLRDFLKASGMPPLSMLVYSGSGGFHAYWCFPEPLIKDEWLRYAEALKRACNEHGFKTDPAVTADAARILRIPSTLNHKTNPPKLCRIDADVTRQGYRYPPEDLAKVLGPFMGERRKTGTGPAATVSAIAANFTEGVADQQLPRLSIDQIAVNCPMTAATLADGGKDNGKNEGVEKSQEQWHLDMFLAAWTIDPHESAHRLSKGHSTYDFDAVEKKLDEKQRVIAAGAGWPKCSKFFHQACLACPLRQLDKSPIHFGHDAARGTHLKPKQEQDDLLPDGYYRSDNNHIMKEESGKKPVDVFGYAFLDAWVDDKFGHLVVQFISSGQECFGAIKPNASTPAACASGWADGTNNRIVIQAARQRDVLGLQMAWIKKLQDRKKVISIDSFGWQDNGDFVFGSQRITPTGAKPVFRGDTAIDEYQRVGELQPWLAAMDIVYENPTLEVMVASAFAAPLVTFISSDSLILSIFSYESAHGKTTSMRIAQAVWGRPGKINQAGDTQNYVLQAVSKLRNLPSYWDEIQLPKTNTGRTDVSVFFRAMPGRDKNRLNKDSRARQQGNEARTIFTLASNKSLASAVAENTEGTDAGGLRVFELQAEPLLKNGIDSEPLINQLYQNYGVAGSIYAEFLVRNRKALEPIINAVLHELDTLCKFNSKERFWRRLMGALLAGAHLANAAGLTHFNPERLQRRLVEALYQRRHEQNAAQIYSHTGPDAAELALHEMMADYRNRHIIETDFIPVPHVGAPRQPKLQNFTTLDAPSFRDVRMQVGLDDGRILVTQRHFTEWMRLHGYEPSHILFGLKTTYAVSGPQKRTMGSGVSQLKNRVQQRKCYEFSPLNRIPSGPSASSDSPAPTTPAS